MKRSTLVEREVQKALLAEEQLRKEIVETLLAEVTHQVEQEQTQVLTDQIVDHQQDRRDQITADLLQDHQDQTDQIDLLEHQDLLLGLLRNQVQDLQVVQSLQVAQAKNLLEEEENSLPNSEINKTVGWVMKFILPIFIPISVNFTLLITNPLLY